MKKLFSTEKPKPKVSEKKSPPKKHQPKKQEVDYKSALKSADITSLSHMSDKEIRDLMDERAIKRALYEKSFRDFCKPAWEAFQPNVPYITDAWHSDCLADHLQALYERQILELCISIPPGHGKSVWSTVLFPAWIWTQTPHWRMVFGSFGYDLSQDHGDKTRVLIDTNWYQGLWGDVYQLISRAKGALTNDQQGARLAVSIGGATTGKRGELIVADDPLQIEEANSEIKRSAVISWWDNTMESRINVTGLKLVICQRLHDFDLVGHLLDRGTFEYLMLPALFEPDRRCKTFTVDGEVFFEDPREKDGEALFPQQFPREEILKRMTRQTDSSLASAMYRQDPVPAGGNIIKEDYFRFYNPEYAPMIENNAVIVIQSWDTAIKSKESSSWTVGQCWAILKKQVEIDNTITLQQGYYLLDQVRLRKDFVGNIKLVKDFIQKHPRTGAILVEDKASGPDLVNVLKTEHNVTGLILSEGNDDKEERCHAISWMWEAGNVYVPGRPAQEGHKMPDFSLVPWMGQAGKEDGFYFEVTRYPKAKFTDQTIAMTQALKYLASKMKSGFGIPSGPIRTSTSEGLHKSSRDLEHGRINLSDKLY